MKFIILNKVSKRKELERERESVMKATEGIDLLMLFAHNSISQKQNENDVHIEFCMDTFLQH